MAHLLRIAALWVLWTLLSPAHAAFPERQCKVVAGNGVPAYAATCQAAANQLTHYYHEQPARVSCSVSYPATGPCSINDYPVDASWTGSCPANSTLAGESCSCNAGFVEKDGMCRPENPCPAGQIEQGGACVPVNCKPSEIRVNGVCVPEPPCPAGQTRVNGQCVKNKCPPAGTGAGDGWEMSGPSTEYACVDQGVSFDGPVMYCMVRVTNTFDFLVDGKRLYFGSGKYTGGTCSGGSGGGSTGGNPGTGGGTGGGSGPGSGGNGGNDGGGASGGGSGGSAPKPPNPDSPPLPPPPGSKPPGPDGGCPPGTSKAPNGQCYSPTPPPLNPDGDGLCPPGYVRVGVVCVAPSPPSGGGSTGGGSGGGGGGNGDGDGEGEQSAFGGACASGFSCEGDAIQCAIAREQHVRACKLFDDESPESKLYNDNKGKEGKQTNDLPGNETVNVFGRIDSSDALGAGGAGLSDLSITVWGKAISLPFSMLNSYLAALGNVLLAVSFLLALRIVARG